MTSNGAEQLKDFGQGVGLVQLQNCKCWW
jgi:hypothetical protein